MQYRELGRTGWKVSSVSFGTWAIGAEWGAVDDQQSLAALHSALDRGVNFFDTADVYGDGRSERLLAQLRAERSDPFYVATKAGRRLNPHVAGGYNRENLTAFVERSLSNLKTDALDLLQLHCPPTDVYYMPEVFEALDGLTKDGKLRHYGVSVEKVEEGLKAIEYPGVETVQIIFNIFRQKPIEFFDIAKSKGVALIVRLPLASGLLSGKFTKATKFAETDHRSYNREGQAFNVGETFAGLPFEKGVELAESLKGFLPEGMTMAQMALRWILDFDAVSVIIPGARNPGQVNANVSATNLPPLSQELHAKLREFYESEVAAHIRGPY